MILFGVETTDRIASAALMKDGELLCVQSADPTYRHAQTVAPLMERMLRENGLTPREIDFFAVDVGPGSFTGVRIGVCLVNAMGFAVDRPVIPVDSLQVIAAGARMLSGRVAALIDAGNGNAYAAQYEDRVCVEAPEAVAIQDYLPRIRAHMHIVGSGVAAFSGLLHRNCRTCTLAPNEFAMPRADALLLAANETLHAADRMVKPVYLRPSQAERMFQKRMEEADK